MRGEYHEHERCIDYRRIATIQYFVSSLFVSTGDYYYNTVSFIQNRKDSMADVSDMQWECPSPDDYTTSIQESMKEKMPFVQLFKQCGFVDCEQGQREEAFNKK
jgi:hypothetical protein